MFAKVLTSTMEASLHCGDTGLKGFRNLRMAAALLDESEQGTILRAKLGERMAERIELLGIDRARRLGDVFMLLAEGQKDPAQLLAAELVDARVAREPEKPRFELRRRLQTIERPDHLDEDLLGQILDVIASSGHGVDETSNTMLVADNEVPLGDFIALLSPADKVSQRGRCS